MDIKETQTEKNLQAALAGESMARNKYTYYAAQARIEGLEETALLFDTMSENEMSHAKVWFKKLNGNIRSTVENLQEAMKGENSEWLSMYPDFAKTAREEGLDELAALFEAIATIEADHEKRFMEEYIKLKTAQGAKVVLPVQEVEKTAEPVWKCLFCGHAMKADGSEAPYVCPICEAMGAFEKIMAKL